MFWSVEIVKYKNKKIHREIINGPLAAHSLAHQQPTLQPAHRFTPSTVWYSPVGLVSDVIGRIFHRLAEGGDHGQSLQEREI